VISLFYAARIAEVFYLVMPQRLIPVAMAALKKYAPFFKAELTAATGDYQINGVITTQDQQPYAAAAVIALPSGKRNIVLQTAADKHQNSALYDDWKLLDMLEGIPSIYPETSGVFLPHDLNLIELNAVSFSKGCYTGQEIIARMHYRGKPKNHLYRGLAKEVLAPGNAIYAANKPAGIVIDCCQKVYNQQYALLFTTDAATFTRQQLQTEQGHSIELQKSE
jgi:folate-binding protein YgfZ